ncbi:MAG: VOC family protein [Candidatus Obscuribacter sp.]|nr:VOC family protein [Candidatus Obscuribacter sp.]
MLATARIHHVAIICSDYERSKKFYHELLGFEIVAEHYRAERQSYKLDLQVGACQIELFSFPDPPGRVTGPEACGLRHLAFEVDNVAEVLRFLRDNGVEAEDIRVDEYTGKRFTFFRDPDNLPLEIYESRAL